MFLRSLSISLCVLFFSSLTQAQGIKIAFVNMEKAMTSAAVAKQLGAKYEVEFDKRKNEVKTLESELRNARRQAVKESLSMSLAQKEELQASLLKKDRQIRFKRAAIEEDAKLVSGRIERAVEEVVLKAVSKITQQENYDLVLVDGVLYSSKQIDITDKVIAQLK